MKMFEDKKKEVFGLSIISRRNPFFIQINARLYVYINIFEQDKSTIV